MSRYAAPASYTSSAILRASGSWPVEAITITSWPGWTLAPNPTASFASLSSVVESTGGILTMAAILPSQMRNNTLARGLALAGVAAASATAAHGGATALADPAWSVPALAAASAGAIALLHMAASAGRARHAAARARHGSPTLAAHMPLGLPETAAVMLAAQGCAHVALLAAGAPAHAGQAGALALHTALALLGAGLVWTVARAPARAIADLGAAVSAALDPLLRPAATPPPAAVPAAPGQPAARARRGPAPP